MYQSENKLSHTDAQSASPKGFLLNNRWDIEMAYQVTSKKEKS